MNRLWILALLASIAATGCAQRPFQNFEAPHYYGDIGITPSRTEDTRVIRLVFTTQEHLDEYYKPVSMMPQYQEQRKKGLIGVTEVGNEGEECRVYVIQPENLNDAPAFYALGHEVLHCFYGSYHRY
ncbi:MAG: hypothetical protein GY770_13050 [Aestuariibacter sp.]|nr:hypothetical protein [Aestuariibacter sp.]MCP5017415.1 hypothetical protein [Ketobacter sp.]